MKKDHKTIALLNNKKGMLKEYLGYATIFAIAVVSFVIVVILLQSILGGTNNNMCATSSYIYNVTSGQCNSPTNASATGGATYAGNITNSGLTFSNNFSTQWGLAGTILGYVLVLSVLALIGVGGYMGYQKIRGSR